SGNDSESVHHAGVAPIAARSDRFTANAFQPMSAGAVPPGKWTPAFSVSIVTTSSWPGGTRRRAASSPMPRTMSGRAAWTRRRMRSMRVNSVMRVAWIPADAGMTGAGGMTVVAPSPRRAHLVRAPVRGGAVEDAIDEGVAVLGAEALGAVDGLVDHHAERDVRAVAQFVGGDAQRGALDLVHLLDAAVQVRGQRLVDAGALPKHALHEVLEVRQVGNLVRLLVRELGDHLLRRAAGHLPLVHGLQ